MANVRGLGDFDKDEDDEKRQAYYAGGQGQNGGGSGQEVLDPRDLMRRAQQDLGAQDINEFNSQQAPTYFSGSGNTVGGQHVEGQQSEQEPSYTITFWRNGFSVNDGPLRTQDDPASAAFLASINKGQVPAELEAAAGRDTDVQVHLVNKGEQDYTPPPVVAQPFAGTGMSMREGGPSVVAAAAEPSSDAEITVNQSEPTTNLQVRFHDGSRKVLKLNHTHTVAQLRAWVASNSTSSPADLMTTFPRKIITDDSQTISEAGLVNETIVQSLK